jgi:hypothetical protein
MFYLYASFYLFIVLLLYRVDEYFYRCVGHLMRAMDHPTNQSTQLRKKVIQTPLDVM